MSVSEASLLLMPSLPEIDRAAAWLDEFAACVDIAPDVTSKFHVVLDELLSNIIRHGGPAVGPVRLRLRRLPDAVELAVIDEGPPFDMSQFEPAPKAIRVTERRVGGAGLLFVRAFMDTIDVTRQDGRNHLVLRKRLTTET